MRQPAPNPIRAAFRAAFLRVQAPAWLRPTPLLTALLASSLAAGCSSTHLAPISIQGANFQPLPEEVELWAETRAEEEEILDGFPVVYDPVLGDYLQKLVERLAPAGLLANPAVDLRISVLEDPAPLAFAFPHGTILVHTGLLDRTVNEDQLAAVLAREIAHVEGRHLGRHQRAVWNRQVGISIAAFTAAILLELEEDEEWEEGDWEEAELLDEMSDDVLFAGYELARRVTADGYGRKLEREADEEAVRLLLDRGYDPRQGLEFYESLGREKDDGYLPVYAEGNELEDRIQSLRRRLASPGVRLAQPPLLDDAGFHLVVRPLPPGSR